MVNGEVQLVDLAPVDPVVNWTAALDHLWPTAPAIVKTAISSGQLDGLSVQLKDGGWGLGKRSVGVRAGGRLRAREGGRDLEGGHWRDQDHTQPTDTHTCNCCVCAARPVHFDPARGELHALHSTQP